jgi:hypothetical protein
VPLDTMHAVIQPFSEIFLRSLLEPRAQVPAAA